MIDRDDETGGAEAALNSSGVDEGLLDVTQHTITSETFDGRDLGVDGRGRQHQARAHGTAIDDDRATSAFTLFAGTFRARESETFAKNVEKTFPDPCVENVVLATVHVERILKG